jgi:hypothetical protein
VYLGADMYGPAADTWSSAGSMGNACYSHTAALLGSGSVLVAGGDGQVPLASAELYNPPAPSQSLSSGPPIPTKSSPPQPAGTKRWSQSASDATPHRMKVSSRVQTSLHRQFNQAQVVAVGQAGERFDLVELEPAAL